MSMESLYHLLGTSRQSFHQRRERWAEQDKLDQELIQRVNFHRQDHPRMGARTLYRMMQGFDEDQALVEKIGRDKFEQILLDNDLGVSPIRNFHKTTYSGSFRFPNLVEGLRINQINSIWVSDLTYYRLQKGWAYLTFILDLYSRRCLGYALSDRMHSEETTIAALEMALKIRGIDNYHNKLTFHSDGGGQYYDKGFLSLLKQYHIQSSMAEIVYENPHAERFHSTAKNDYLIPWNVNSMSQLNCKLPKFLKLYNQVRPHQSLNGLTPIAFEKHIQHIPINQRTSVLFKKVT